MRRYSILKFLESLLQADCHQALDMRTLAAQDLTIRTTPRRGKAIRTPQLLHTERLNVKPEAPPIPRI